MAYDKNSVVPTIVVGCGGSGLATIQKLNHLMASNPDLVSRMGDEMFYLAIDTDKRPLKGFAEAVEADMNGYPAPFIAEVQLSSGLRILKQVTDHCMVRPFVGKSDSPALDRLKEHWWFRRGKPFEAPAVSDLTTGAGQCPPASYCLAWYRMGEISKQIGAIINEVKSKFGKLVTGEGDDAIVNVNVFVVAGLAGGTGRGVWELVAYKIRDIFEKKFGIPVNPIGIFFTDGAFRDVKDEYPHQIPALKTNSLTGVSELVCLMKAGRSASDAELFRMKMPNLQSPHREQTDAFGVDTTLSPRTSPVHSAYLVCGDRSDGVLDSCKQYYEMAGAALYSMIADANIKSVACNDDDPFLSFASNTFEVDVTHLRAYFENRVRSIALKRQKITESDATESVNAFLAAHPLVSPVPTIRQALGDKNGPLLRRAVSFLLEDVYGDRLRELVTKMSQMKPEKGIKGVNDLLVAASDDEIRAAFAKALESTGDVEKMIDEEVFKVYCGDGTNQSVGRAKDFVEKLADVLEARLKAISVKSPEINAEAAQADARLRDACEYVKAQVKRASKRKLGETLKGLPYFLPSEVSGLVNVDKNGEFAGDVVMGLIAINYEPLRAALAAVVERWRNHLAALKKNYGTLLDYMGTAQTRFETMDVNVAGGDDTETAYEVLFTDPLNVESGLPSENDHTTFYKRKLIPIMARDEVELLAEKAVQVRAGLDQFVQEAVRDIRKMGSRESFLNKLAAVVRQNVYIKNDFCETNFAFCKILERNLVVWNEKLAGLTGDARKLSDFSRRLKAYLGVEPIYDKQLGYYVLPPLEHVLTCIVSMLADDCKPWWLITAPKNVADSAVGKIARTVFISERIGHRGYVSDLETKVKGKLQGAQVKIYDPSCINGGASHFMIVAYANQILLSRNFDDVALFCYSASDECCKPVVDKWLQLAERKDGELIFSTEDRNKGCGYPSPIFVNNPVLAANRWHPWLKGDFGTVEDEDMALKALLYAFLGNGESEELAKLATVGWSLPLIKIGPRQQFMIARKALTWSGKAATEDPDCMWLVDEKICVSLANLCEYLNGNGKTGLNGKLVDKDIAEGKALRRGIAAEEAVFMAKLVNGKFGPEFFANLRAARDKWFAARRDAARRGKGGRKEDAEIWQKLIKLSARLADE